MPADLERCVQHLLDKGYDKNSAYPICKTSMNMSQDKEQNGVNKYAEDLAMENKKKLALEEETKRFNEAMQTKDIMGVEIFAAGEWNGDKYSVDDLDQLIVAFNETKDKLKPYVKLGHGEKQKLLAEDELPAAGWIVNLYREGRKLLADVKNIPKKIYDLIKNKAYARISSEIFTNIRIDGKEYPYALKAISLLGGETPAVHNLDDIMALYAQSVKAIVFETEAKVRRYEFSQENLLENKQEEKNMEELEKAKQEIVSLKEENSKLTAELEESKKFSQELTEKNEALKKEKRYAEINAKVDQLIKDKKILPAQSETLKTILLNAEGEKKFKMGDKEMSSEELILNFVNSSNVSVNTEGKTETGKTQDLDQDSKVKEFMAKNKVSYKEALVSVASEGK